MKGNELQRVKNIINNDRFRTSDCFLELLNKDLSKLFRDYFDFRGNPDVLITKDNGGYFVEVKLPVDRLKAFGIV